MSSNVRPESMERITTPALANAFIAQQIEEIRAQVGSRKVLLALSGGVDSSVVAALLIKAIGKQLVCVHVNHGLLRKGEPEQVVKVFRDEMDANLIYVDAVDRFLDKLAGVSDPETKRKIIGKEFIEVFNDEAKKLEGIDFLAQGTIYPDILESHGVKAHHNVGGLPEGMTFELVEPVKLLFKDEVRVVGEALGLPHSMVYRQPFPGPGLGVRCLGAITRDRLEALREADAILREEFDNPAITTDVIVGFPGETEEEFAETERFLKAIHFYEMHIFKYSRRAGTRAADMPDQVPEGIKSVRSDILLALEKQQSLEYRGRFLGTEEEILLEEPIEIDGTKYMMGHPRQYVKGAVPYEEGLKNKTVKGIFTKALNEEVLLLESE